MIKWNPSKSKNNILKINIIILITTNNLIIKNQIDKPKKIKDHITIIVGLNGRDIDKDISILIILNSTITITCWTLIHMRG
jgi:hypothetical protein